MDEKYLHPIKVWRLAVAALTGLGLVTGCSSTSGSSRTTPVCCRESKRTEQIHQAVADWLAHWPTPSHTANLTDLAERIVDRLAAGGKLYLAGDTGFSDEMCFRAGGFAGSVVWNARLPHLGTNDVLLVGRLEGGSKATREFWPVYIADNRSCISSALTIVVASARWPLVARTLEMADASRWPSGLHLLDTDAPPTVSMSDFAVGQIATIAAAHALEGEMIAAATRRNRTLAFYPSIFAPGGQAFCEQIRGKAFLDEPRIGPIPAGHLAHAYLTACHDQVEAFSASEEPQQVRRAAERIVACQRRGATVLTIVGGHVLQRGATLPPELSSLALYGSLWQWDAPHGLHAGDLFCDFGYLDYPQKNVDAARGVGAEVVTLSVAGGPAQEQVTNIRCFWKAYDGVVEVSGYPAGYRALPSSGVVMSAVWYSLMDEALACLASP